MPCARVSTTRGALIVWAGGQRGDWGGEAGREGAGEGRRGHAGGEEWRREKGGGRGPSWEEVASRAGSETTRGREGRPLLMMVWHVI